MKTQLIAITLGTMLLCGCSEKQSQSNALPKVRLATAQISTSYKQNSYPGRTFAEESAAVAFKVSGTIASIPVKVGDKVRKGQVIARMDPKDYNIQLTATKAEYASVKSECERIIALYNDGGTSELAYDKARYGLEQITQKLQHAQDQVNDCVIYAPFDGYIQSIISDEHEVVSAGMPVVSVFGSKNVEVAINVPASEYLRSKDFKSFVCSFSALDGKQFTAHLKSVGQKANANQLYEVRLTLEGDLSLVTPGMTALVDIYYGGNGEVPMEVPANAVFADSEGKSYVYVYNEQGTGEDGKPQGVLKKTPVRVTVVETNGNVHVLKGLSAGQKVVASGVHHLLDGQQVQPNPETRSTNVGGLL